MKNLVLSFLLLFLFQAATANESKDVTCSADSLTLAPEMPHLVVNLKFENNKADKLIVNSKNESKVIEEVEVDLKNIEEFMQCNFNKENCVEKFYPKANLNQRTIPIALVLLKVYLEEGFGRKTTIPINKVNSGKLFSIEKPNPYFGGSGLIEYYDSNKKVVGRILMSIEAMECN